MKKNIVALMIVCSIIVAVFYTSCSSDATTVSETLITDLYGHWAWEHSKITSPDGKREAYVSQRGLAQLVVVDGIKGKYYDRIKMDSLIFSPDNQRLAYMANNDNKWFVVVDDEEIGEYYETGFLSFSTDSQNVQ